MAWEEVLGPEKLNPQLTGLEMQEKSVEAFQRQRIFVPTDLAGLNSQYPVPDTLKDRFLLVFAIGNRSLHEALTFAALH